MENRSRFSTQGICWVGVTCCGGSDPSRDAHFMCLEFSSVPRQAHGAQHPRLSGFGYRYTVEYSHAFRRSPDCTATQRMTSLCVVVFVLQMPTLDPPELCGISDLTPAERRVQKVGGAHL